MASGLDANGILQAVYDPSNKALRLSTSAVSGVPTVINVKDAAYGAKGDGVTNDTSAIQAAISGAGSGATVFFPAGTYLISSALSLPTGVTLCGAGPGATVITTNSATANMVTFAAGANDAGVQSLKLTAAVTRTAGAALAISTGIRLRVRDVNMTGQYNGLVVSGGATVVWVEDGYWNNFAAGGTAILIQGGNDHLLRGLVVDNPAGAQPAAGINIQASTGTWVSDCDFIHSGTGLLINPVTGQTVQWLFVVNSAFDLCSSRGVFINPTGTGVVEGVDLIGCWSSSSGANEGTYIGGAGTLDGVRLVGHRSYNNATNGIYLATPATNVSLDACDVAGNSQSAPGTNHGIVIATSGVSVRNCRSGQSAGFGNTQATGIVTTGSIDNYVIVGNDVRGNTVGINDAATGSVNHKVAQNLGFNPRGSVTAPGIPASTTPFSHTFGIDMTVHITGGTVSTIAIGGTTTGATSGTFRVPAGQSITLTYTVAPTWTWFGD